MSHILGIGTDIIECLRIAQMIERHGELFITRVYTDYEIDYCSTKKAATQHYAGRWAAKEAVLKALGTGWIRGISWRDIEVRNDRSGAPSVFLRGGAREVTRFPRYPHHAPEHQPLPYPRHGLRCSRRRRDLGFMIWDLGLGIRDCLHVGRDDY